MNFSQKLFSFFIAWALTLHTASAQLQKNKGITDFPKNAIKLNVLALPLRTLSVQYERGFTERIAADLSVRLQPTGSIPLKSVFTSVFGIRSQAGLDFAENARTSSYAITAEGRFYFGRRPLNGLYIAPFLRYSYYKIDWTYDFQNEDSSVTVVGISGEGSGITGGLMVGAQWHLKHHWLIDWWIAGASYGRLNLSLTGEGGLENMKPEDKGRLEYEIRSITIGGSSFGADVGQNSIHVTGSIPFPGIRTGLCIGLGF